ISRHNIATANWKRVNMNLLYSDDVEVMNAILGHELTHVYIEALSEQRFARRFGSTRWFHEGLASYLEYRLFLRTERIQQLGRQAAVVFDREQVEFELLVDNAAWLRKYDSNLVYALGEAFMHGLVDRYGDEAPGKIIRATNRPEAPVSLSGMAFWRDAFQACGYDLSSAIDGFYQHLGKLKNENKAFVDSLPRMRARITSEDSWIGLEPLADLALPAGAEVICQFRGSPEDGPEEYHQVPLGEDGKFWVSGNLFPGRTLWYQLGLSTDETDYPIYEPWKESRVR
ncbi:MAG: hypothetical protein AAF514_11165, partial [Verrucomicrobiota bacterium]